MEPQPELIKGDDMADANSETPFEQLTDKGVPTGYLPPTAAAWIELPDDKEPGNGHEATMQLLGLLARCTAPGMDPRMRGLAGKAFRECGITGIMVQVTQGKGDESFTVQTHVMRADGAAPCAGE